MKAFIGFILALTFINGHAFARMVKIDKADAPARSFIFIENNSDSNFFVTPAGALDPRMTGSNRWTGLKYTGSGHIYQQSLGYIDNGENRPVEKNWKFDMWLENSAISNPLLGMRCINWYSGCNLSTSLLEPQITDSKGFYGVTVSSGGQKWMHGMMSDSFYQYLQAMPVGSSLSMTINGCKTPDSYDATAGARCRDQSHGIWVTRRVTHTKAASIRLINTGALSEVFIDSDGVATPGQDNSNCHRQYVGNKSGLSCKMVDYNVNSTGISNVSVHVFPYITKSYLSSSVKGDDVQFSLDGNKWKKINKNANYFTFNDLKMSNAVYVFFSKEFFRQVVRSGLSDSNTKDLINFRFENKSAPESGWYEFSTSNRLVIKPRNFGVSIISDDMTSSPSRQGYAGFGKPALDFKYFITTSGNTAADEVSLKVTGPQQKIHGTSYCVFTSEDGKLAIPFPATLSFITSRGMTKTYYAGCDDSWKDITGALWNSEPHKDTEGNDEQLNKTSVIFSILMGNLLSQQTTDGNQWYGNVSASGEIHVRAVWRNTH